VGVKVGQTPGNLQSQEAFVHMTTIVVAMMRMIMEAEA
jgi:hypothetical protein